jgi:signal transduction histidine kinase
MNLEQFTTFLGYSTVFNFALLTYWFLMILFAKKIVFALHQKWFDIDESALSQLHYKLMAQYKLAIIFSNLIPYVILKYFL